MNASTSCLTSIKYDGKQLVVDRLMNHTLDSKGVCMGCGIIVEGFDDYIKDNTLFTITTGGLCQECEAA